MPNRTILVIEDDIDVRETLAQTLRLMGYSVELAANGLEGLEALSKKPSPCLILLDLMMPIMNGWQFLNKVSEINALDSLPIIIISAFREKIPSSKQIVGFIKKPITLDELLTAIQRYCGDPTL